MGVDVLTSKSDETYEAETDEAETDEAETDEAETDEAETDEAETDEAETDEAETDEAETDEAETDEAETDEAETDEADVEEGNSLVEKVETDNLIGLERDDIEASDQPLPTLAKGKEAHVLASQQKEDSSLAEMRRMGDEQVMVLWWKRMGCWFRLS